MDGPKHVLATTVRYFMSYDQDYFTSSLEFRKALQLSIDVEDITTSMFPSEAAYGGDRFGAFYACLSRDTLKTCRHILMIPIRRAAY